MVTRAKVYLGEHFGSHKLIKQNINVGQWVFVLDGYCIVAPKISFWDLGKKFYKILELRYFCLKKEDFS
jgi:hypothetical protein